MPVAAATLETLENLAHAPASDVKKLGWRGVMELVRHEGSVVVTNHDRPEAVILPVAEYERLLKLMQKAGEKDRATLDALRRKWDDQLKQLNAPGARAKFDSIFDKPLDLGGKIFTGHEF